MKIQAWVNLPQRNTKKKKGQKPKPNAKESKRTSKKIKKNQREHKTPQGGGWWPRPPCKCIIA